MIELLNKKKQESFDEDTEVSVREISKLVAFIYEGAMADTLSAEEKKKSSHTHNR